MIEINPLENLLRHILASKCIKGEKPLSSMFIAPVEAGKTTLIRKYCLRTDGVFYTTDATAFGIIRDTNNLRDIEDGKYSHIVIPDLINCLARRENTVSQFTSFMNALIEDGVVNISTYATRIQEADKRKVHCTAGLITAVTPGVFIDKRRRWGKIGFLSRVLPVSYSYSTPTVLKIFEYIEDQRHLEESIEKLKLPRKQKKDIELPKELSKKTELYSIALARAADIFGFRLQRQFQTLLKTIAFLDGSDIVQERHFRQFEEFSKFINMDMTKI